VNELHGLQKFNGSEVAGLSRLFEVILIFGTNVMVEKICVKVSQRNRRKVNVLSTLGIEVTDKERATGPY
jgi:hypothetical protein